MALLYDTGLFSVVNSDSSIGVGWKLNFYISGTTTRKATYPTLGDAVAGTNPNSNPVVADSNGRFGQIWLVDSAYKAVLTTAADVVKVTRDPAVSSDGGGLIVTPEFFGAVGDGVTDDSTAINAMFAYCIGEPGVNVVMAGRYAIASPLTYTNPDTVNYSDDSTLRTTFEMSCAFIATAAMDHMLTFRRVAKATILGRIHFFGGSTTLSARYAANGLFLDNCGGSDVLANVTGDNLIYSVYELETSPSNNNLARIDSVSGKRVGCSSFSDNLHNANYSARVDTGSANASDQRATFTMTSLPPVYTDAAYRPVFAVIGGYYHRVMSVDRGASKISITPWPSSTVATGTLRYAYGAIVSLRGTDGNLVNVGTISSQNCAGALSVQSLYGGAIGTIHCESTGIGITVGSDPSSTILGLTIDRLYCESTDVDAAFQAGVPDGVRVLSATPFDEAKIINAGWYSPGGATTPIYDKQPVGIWLNGKTSTPARNDASASTLDMSLAHTQGEIWTAPTATPSFTITAPTSDVIERLYRKPFRMSVEVPVATVASGIPTSVTFTAPGGWTVNGGASVTFNDIDSVPEFSISPVFGSTTLTVRKLVPTVAAGPHFALPLATGATVINIVSSTTPPGTATAADRVDAGLVIPARDLTVTALGVDVTAAVAASNLKIAIYDYDTMARLGASADISTAATGVKTWTTGFTFRKGHRYLVAVHASAAISYRAVTANSCLAIDYDAAAGALNTVIRQAVAYAGGTPNPLAGTKTSGASPPAIIFTAA